MKALPLSVAEFEEPKRRWLRWSEVIRVGSWSIRLVSLLEKTAEDSLSTLEEDGKNDHVRTQQEVDHLQARKKAFTRNQIKQNFDLEFLATSIVRNKFLLFKPLSLWYFVMTAQATTGQCKKEILELKCKFHQGRNRLFCSLLYLQHLDQYLAQNINSINIYILNVVVVIYLRSYLLLPFATPWTVAHQAPLSMDFPGKNTGVGCHFLL